VKRILFSGLFLFVLLPGLLLGAEVTADTTTSHPVVLWQRLAAQLQQAQQTGNPIKCMTPHLLAAEQARRTGGIDAHNGSESGAYPPAVVNPDGTQNDQALTASVREARAYLTALQQYRAESPIEIANTETYISPSGRFRLEFTRTGSHAVPSADLDGSGIPDYIERAAEYADESYVYLIETLGYRDFLVPGSPYLFRFLNIDAYGYTQSQGETTFIAVHNTFEGFPPNDNPGGSQLGALKVTIAHEMMHAIQYVYNRFYWANFNVSLDWLEMDATMIEELVYDEVNDYYNYIDGSTSVFGNPNGSTPLAYEHVTWSLFYAEEIGLDFWVDVWEEIAGRPSTAQMTGVMRTVMQDRGLDFNTEFTRNHSWHAASGTLHLDGFGFQEAAAYPTPRRTFHFAFADSVRTLPQQTRARAAQYVVINEVASLVGEIGMTVSFTGSAAGAALMVVYQNGEYDVWQQTASGEASGGGGLRITTTARWEEARQVRLIFANPTDADQDITYSLEARQLPEQLTVLPNYPNPFNTTTTISFALPEPGFVTVDVYTVTGQRAARLVHGELNRGFYDIPFNARGLASGVYLYVVKTPTRVESGKMMFVK